MKTVFVAASILAIFSLNTHALAAKSPNGCEIKKQNIEKQIEYAKANGNNHRLDGLQRALDNVNRYCTPESLYKDSQKDVAEKLQEVKEREAELQESIQKGDTDKVAKRERKLAEAKTELQEAEAELKTFKDAL